MSEDQAERVVLDLDPGEPIHGRITFSAGPVQAFHGWLDLASKLERALPPVGDAIATPPHLSAER